MAYRDSSQAAAGEIPFAAICAKFVEAVQYARDISAPMKLLQAKSVSRECANKS